MFRRRVVNTTMLETDPPVPFALVCLHCWNLDHLDHEVTVTIEGRTPEAVVRYDCQRCGAVFYPAGDVC